MTLKKTLHVIVYSGGLDSTTLLYDVRAKQEVDPSSIRLLNFNYGQKHIKERQYAKKHVKLLGFDKQNQFLEINLSPLKKIFVSSSLTNNQITIPWLKKLSKDEKTKSLQQTVVPARNAIFLTIAASYADSLIKRNPDLYDSANIYYACHSSDFGMYPDCRPRFVNSINEMVKTATDNEALGVIAPFVYMTKGDIVKLGSKYLDLGSNTWSCYKGLFNHCGECSSCLERRKAFHDAHVNDTTVYGERKELERPKETYVRG